VNLRRPPEQVQGLARQALADLPRLADALADEILREDPAYGGGRTEPEDLRRSCHDNLARILGTLSGTADDSLDVLDAPRATGQRRAEQGVALETVLHSYRLGHRIVWDALVEQARADGSVEVLLDAASYVWELVDTFSSAVGAAYREQERALRQRDASRRDALFDALVEGGGHDHVVVADAAATLDLPEDGRFVLVVVAGTASGSAVGRALAGRGVRVAWRTKADRELALVSLGSTTVEAVVRLLDAVPGLRAGVSPAFDGLGDADAAHRLAQTALRALPAGASGARLLDADLPGALLVTAPDLAERLLHQALGPVLALPPDERVVLLDTLRTWLATGGSASQAAARLYCHRNTVLNRLRRLEALTGGSLERVDDLVSWSLALQACALLPGAPTVR
jgi:hypothetical protein